MVDHFVEGGLSLYCCALTILGFDSRSIRECSHGLFLQCEFCIEINANLCLGLLQLQTPILMN